MPSNNEQLQAFFLYCQAVETAYHEWKNYWVNFYLNNKNKDLYNPEAYNMSWFKTLKENWH